MESYEKFSKTSLDKNEIAANSEFINTLEISPPDSTLNLFIADNDKLLVFLLT